jgi:hypothetical protein
LAHRINGVHCAATQVLTSAEQLARQAETLRSDVDDFLADIRAA